MEESNKIANTGRYTVKFVHGFWTTFDTVEYQHTHLHYLKKDAIEFTKKLNQRSDKTGGV